MHILVTGGAGYVGSVSVEAFLAAGHAVTVLIGSSGICAVLEFLEIAQAVIVGIASG